MASKFLTAKFERGTLELVVLLDTTRTLAGGVPDPAYVRSYTYGAPPRNNGEGVAAYRARLRTFADQYIAEAKLLVALEAGVAPDPAGQVTLTEDGTTF
jgi:hypothetical protein